MIRLVTAILCVAGLAGSGCFHTKHPTAAKVAGGALLAVSAVILISVPSCNGPSPTREDHADDEFLEGLGEALYPALCAMEQVMKVGAGLAFGTPGAIFLGSGIKSSEQSAPPTREFYGTTAPGLANATRARFDGPSVQLLAVPDANPAAVQMARTAWFAARLGRCESVAVTSRQIAALDSNYFQLAVVTNATIATCLQR